MVNLGGLRRFANVGTVGNGLLGGLSYFSRKAEGQDDERAITGAIGDTVAGLAGFAAGNTVAGPVGGVVVGGLASNVVGHGVDAVNDFFRGDAGKNNNTAQASQSNNQENRRMTYNENGQQTDDQGNPIGNLTAGGALAYGTFRMAQQLPGAGANFNYTNPIQNYQVATQISGNPLQAGRYAAETALQETGQALNSTRRAIPGAFNAMGKGGKLALIGGSLYLLDQVTGKPVEHLAAGVLNLGGKAIDNIDGGATNFSGGGASNNNPNVETGQLNSGSLEQEIAARQNGAYSSNLTPEQAIAYRQTNDDRYNSLMDRQDARESLTYAQQMASNRQYYGAQQALAMINDWSSDAQGIAAMANSVNNAAYKGT
jgi:hypothetical protein